MLLTECKGQTAGAMVMHARQKQRCVCGCSALYTDMPRRGTSFSSTRLPPLSFLTGTSLSKQSGAAASAQLGLKCNRMNECMILHLGAHLPCCFICLPFYFAGVTPELTLLMLNSEIPTQSILKYNKGCPPSHIERANAWIGQRREDVLRKKTKGLSLPDSEKISRLKVQRASYSLI